MAGLIRVKAVRAADELRIVKDAEHVRDLRVVTGGYRLDSNVQTRQRAAQATVGGTGTLCH